MSNQVDQEVHDIVTALSQSEETNDEPHDESQPRRTVNIYIEVDEQEEGMADNPSTIDSTLDEQHPMAPRTDDRDTSSRSTYETGRDSIIRPQQRRAHPALLLCLIVPLVGMVAGITYATVLVPMWTPSASVTIVTQAQHLTTTSTLHLVTTGNADPAKNQLAGRTLPALTMSQQKTIPTTGITHQAAQTAYGTITFYNAAPSVQTIEAGTLLTGADGVQVLTEQTAFIPAAVLPTEGYTTVRAHAALAGPHGNIRAGDLYGACCRMNVFVTNGAFRGGQDARSYQSVTEQDITGATTSMKSSLEQSIQAALQTQVQPSETLITPLACTSKITPDHVIGEEAVQVTVTIEETCTGTTYNTQTFTTLTTQRASQDATKRLGTGYTTTGVHSRLVTAMPSTHGTLTLRVESRSLWAYPFRQKQQESIKATIAGMSKDRAIATVLHMPGVQSVSITLKNGSTLPHDTRHVSILFVQM